jgi:hypothetical protein
MAVFNKLKKKSSSSQNMKLIIRDDLSSTRNHPGILKNKYNGCNFQLNTPKSRSMQMHDKISASKREMRMLSEKCAN